MTGIIKDHLVEILFGLVFLVAVVFLYITFKDQIIHLFNYIFNFF